MLNNSVYCNSNKFSNNLAFELPQEMESNFASMIPKDFAENQYRSAEDESISDNRLKMSQDSSGADDEGHISTSEGESLEEDELKSLDMNPPARRVSKSESFSHNSEFDVAKMRRKKFASAASKTQDTKRGNSTIDLRRSSHHSSSEEDIRVPFTPKEDDNLKPGMRSNGLSGHNTSNKIQDFRAASMHNLTSGNEQKLKKTESSRISSRENKNSIQKTTSLREIPSGDSLDSTKESDDMMQLFRNQLEAQFEQWKTEFLSQHGLKEPEAAPVSVEKVCFPFYPFFFFLVLKQSKVDFVTYEILGIS